MQVKQAQLTPTTVKLTVTADQIEMNATKHAVLLRLGREVKVPGFRAGKAPEHLLEKQLDPAAFQSEFLDQIVNQLYVQAAQSEKLRPVGPPNIEITKFVPFTTVEFTAEVDVVGEIKLPDYRKIKLAMKPVEVTAQDVSGVLDNLLSRGATKKVVQRPAKSGDEVTIDFTGLDAKTKEPIAGADGQDYPLVLGSNSFIPGFEDALIGIKAGGEVEFTLTFPKDYGSAELQNRKVSFRVTARTVTELVKSKLDDAFAATIGPFKTLAELKADIKQQLKVERQQEQQREYDNQLLQDIATNSTVAIPDVLVEQEIDRIEEEEKRNLVYRGQTWQEHLDAEGIDADAHRAKNRAGAELRVKAGLVLGEVVERERIVVTPEELDLRIQLLKGQYTDASMQAELDKSESRRDIGNRMLSEKALDFLREAATATKA